MNERNREDLDEVSNRRLTSMALDVARGLAYLASLKYVHRDVACRSESLFCLKHCQIRRSSTIRILCNLGTAW